MQKPRQRQITSARIVTAATFAVLAILTGCNGHMPTEPSAEPAVDIKPVVAANSDDRCILINGQLYCY